MGKNYIEAGISEGAKSFTIKPNGESERTKIKIIKKDAVEDYFKEKEAQSQAAVEKTTERDNEKAIEANVGSWVKDFQERQAEEKLQAQKLYASKSLFKENSAEQHE